MQDFGTLKIFLQFLIETDDGFGRITTTYHQRLLISTPDVNETTADHMFKKFMRSNPKIETELVAQWIPPTINL